MRKKYRKTAAFLLSVMLLLTAAVSPAVYAAAQDIGFSDTVKETPGMETQDTLLSGEEPETMLTDGGETQEKTTTESMESETPEEETTAESTGNTETEQDTVIVPEEDSFSDGTDWTQETEEEFISGIEEIEPENESENKLESGEPLMKKAAARNAVLLAANSDSSDWFATAEELLTSYDTNNSTSQPGKKVYFGQSSSGSAQEWWIVGRDSSGGGLVLFAASPLTSAVFSNSRDNRTYSVTGQEVYANHYGASDLIKTLKGLETNTAYFSTAEQNLMMDTTVYTEDRKNSNQVYSTTGKLYAAYGDYYSPNDTYVTAGTNSSDSLNGGLRIDMGYWGDSVYWLRAPSPNSNFNFRYYALLGCPGYFVHSRYVYFSYSVVPAFQLNLPSVLFASAASAASSNGTLTTGDTFTLRYTDTSIGSAQINVAKDSVQVTGAASGVYLVVQNSEGAYAVSVSGNTSVSASAVTINGKQLTSFRNCRVWLEKTSDRMTKATLATNEGWDVTVQAGTGMRIDTSSGKEEQSVKKGEAITSITYEAAEGYYFPSDYSVSGTNGLVITVSSDNESITISGTPTADTTFTLPDASQKPKAPTPTVTRQSGSASTLTITPLTDTDTYGDARYSIDNGATWQESNEFTNLKAGKTYTVLAKYLGKGFYMESEIGTGSIATDSADYTISIPATAQAGGDSVNIEVNTEQKFDLGYNGQVNVKVKADSVISTGGIVTLTRQDDPQNKTITSAMFVNGIAFTDITQNVATFKTIKDGAVSVSFAAPAETGIAAGTYSGTITFEISYSEP